MVPKDDDIGYHDCLCVVAYEGVAAIMIHRRADVEALNPRKYVGQAEDRTSVETVRAKQ